MDLTVIFNHVNYCYGIVLCPLLDCYCSLCPINYVWKIRELFWQFMTEFCCIW